MEFNAGTYIEVYGGLVALGSDSIGITFTRNGAGADWSGLHFESGSYGSLEYCTIEYATLNNAPAIDANQSFPRIEHCMIRQNGVGISVYGAVSPSLSVNNVIQNNAVMGVHFVNCTNPSVSNQTIIGHAGTYGAIFMDNTGGFHMGSGNNITGNSWGLTMNIGSYPDWMSYGNIPMTGNTNSDGIQVYGGSTEQNVAWHDMNADFIVTSSPGVAVGDTLRIDDNVTVKFAIGNNVLVYGTLIAPGTSRLDGILFTRRTSTDEWSGLRFELGATGRLEHCTIEYATYDDGKGVEAYSPASLEMSHCLLRNNDYGLYGSPASPHVINCQIINNTSYGMYLAGASNPSLGDSLAEWNDIYGNGIYDVHNGSNYIVADFVYWGTLDSTSIATRIYNNGSSGIVDFLPWTNAAHDTLFTNGAIAAPQHLVITINHEVTHYDSLTLSWDPVPGAMFYRVYSSDEPGSGFSQDVTGIFNGTTWTAPIPGVKRFYYVTAM